MANSNFKRGLRRLGKMLGKASPGILAGISCAGVVVTAIIAAKNTQDAADIIEAANLEKDDIIADADDGYITEREAKQYLHDLKVRFAKQLARAYAPTAASAVLTIATIIFSQKIHFRRTAVLTGALNAAQASLQEYRAEAKAFLKPKQYEELEEKVAKKKVDKQPPSEDVIYHTGHGNQLFMTKGGRYFRSSYEYIKTVLFDLTKLAYVSGEASENDFYEKVGIPVIPDGDLNGWSDYDVQKPGDIITVDPVWLTYENPMTGAPESCGILRFFPEMHLI